MKRALLVLTPSERAIFNVRAATEGVHKSRPHPTGASLLGWAARTLYREFETARAWHIFHSGAVRFSDALPLVHGGHVAFPAPKLLMSLKSNASGVSRGGLLDKDSVWIGRPAFNADQADGSGDAKKQVEALKIQFLTDQLEVFTPPGGGRLRTATEKGRAKEQALFGYRHLEPVAAANSTAVPVRYAATIEGDLTAGEWKRLREVFTREPLRLGRAAGTSYGGWYACDWSDNSRYLDFWQEKPFRNDLTDGDGLLRIWLLSDLAVVDDDGSPCFRPAPDHLGLPEGGELVGTQSVTEARRYAPWNGALDGRDVERQVIAAGSVLTYRYRKPIPADRRMPLTAGLFQEQGLGRLWVDPPLLRGTKPVPAAAEEAVPAAARAGATVISHTDRDDVPPSAIARWASDKARLAATGGRDALGRDWVEGIEKHLKHLRRAGVDGPSPSQWKEAANAARGARDFADLLMQLFDSPNAVCGSERARTRRDDWAGEFPVRDWLRERLEEARDKPLDHIRWALDYLARDRAQKLRAGREERRHG